MDFTLTNPSIHAYFYEEGKPAPTAELMYLHEHPLIEDNFINQIDKKVNQTLEICLKHSLNGNVPDKFLELAVSLGIEVAEISSENAGKILNILKDLNSFCDSLLNQYSL